ncbi:MAG: type II toxin-antitoxin system HicB family antitoxin [bacterium]|nr:type II toxin-antitoxin system HicB family antitoxin [bacterium]
MQKTERWFTAVYKKTGAWYSGWIEEIPGVNTQGKTLREVKENLREALLLVLETNRSLSCGGSARGLIRESLAVHA